MQQYLIGIDIGTGSTKAVALTATNDLLGGSKCQYAILQPQPGYSEQDPEVIWKALITCITGLVGQIGYAPQGISLSSAMHSLIPVDVGGKALGNMITWADTRAESIAQTTRDAAEGEYIYRTSGTPIHPMSPLCKLIWLKENEPGLFQRAYKFIGIKEYIWHKLFGAFEVDHSIASATGLFDIRNLKWSDEICSFAGIGINKLSLPVSTTYTRRDIHTAVAEQLNIPLDTAFTIGASDGCCANLGSGATQSGIAALTIGTSGAVRVTSNTPVDNFAAMTFNYLLDEKTFVSGGAVNNGGIAVDWLLTNFLGKPVIGKADYQELFTAISTVPAGSEGLLFLPYLHGERAPLWDAKASGAFLNIKPLHTRAYFLRAGLEGICFALNNVLESLETASGPITQLNVSGGFIHSGVWMQLLADITGKQLALVQTEDASAIGAIYLAMRERNELSPNMGEDVTNNQLNINAQSGLPLREGGADLIVANVERHAVYAHMFPIFKKLYADTKASLQLLNQLNLP